VVHLHFSLYVTTRFNIYQSRNKDHTFYVVVTLVNESGVLIDVLSLCFYTDDEQTAGKQIIAC